MSNNQIVTAILCCAFCSASHVKSYAQDDNKPEVTQLPNLSRSWFYSSIVPFSLFDKDFLALSISPDSIHSQLKAEPQNGFKKPLWIDVWNGGISNVAQLRADNYDPRYSWPRSMIEGENLYLFFLSKKSDVQDETPVMRKTPGGWAWQRLDTVEISVRRRMCFADWEKETIFNSLGEIVADLSVLRDQIPVEEELIDLGCQKIGQKWIGLTGVRSNLGEPIKESLIQGLSYSKLYSYEVSPDLAPKLHSLTPLEKGTNEPTKLIENAGVRIQNDRITFGFPIYNVKSESVFYWYCIQSASTPKSKRYFLAEYKNQETRIVTGYILDWPHSSHWNGTDWLKEKTQMNWNYQAAFDLGVQPIVGLNNLGRVVAYAPPYWLLLDNQ